MSGKRSIRVSGNSPAALVASSPGATGVKLSGNDHQPSPPLTSSFSPPLTSSFSPPFSLTPPPPHISPFSPPSPPPCFPPPLLSYLPPPPSLLPPFPLISLLPLHPPFPLALRGRGDDLRQGLRRGPVERRPRATVPRGRADQSKQTTGQSHPNHKHIFLGL